MREYTIVRLTFEYFIVKWEGREEVFQGLDALKRALNFIQSGLV